MIRNLKVLGLALTAVFALSAVLASAASAEFTSESPQTELTATALEEQVFTGAGAEVTCTEVSVHGTIGEVQKEVTVEPTYGGHCTVNGFPAKVDTNECHYLFTTIEEVGVHILCPEGKQIEVTAEILGSFRKCLDIHAQTPTEPVVHYRNKTNPITEKMDVEIESTVHGITYERTGLCQGEVNEANDAHYIGRVTVTGDDSEGNPVGVTHSLFPNE